MNNIKAIKLAAVRTRQLALRKRRGTFKNIAPTIQSQIEEEAGLALEDVKSTIENAIDNVRQFNDRVGGVRPVLAHLENALSAWEKEIATVAGWYE